MDAQTKGEMARRLRRICLELDIVFFYPVVFRIFLDKIPRHRLLKRNSALQGSSEYLIEDLDESASEFDILFLDYRRDPDFETLINLPISDSRSAIELLLRRCEP